MLPTIVLTPQSEPKIHQKINRKKVPKKSAKDLQHGVPEGPKIIGKQKKNVPRKTKSKRLGTKDIFGTRAFAPGQIGGLEDCSP